MIYFVKAPSGQIKIGTTINLYSRIRQLSLQYRERLEVLAVTDGDRRVESSLHRQFAHRRVGGEWFMPGDDLLNFIKTTGRPWDGRDESSMRGIKLGKHVHEKLKIIAAHLDRDLADVLTELASPSVDTEWRKAVLEQGRIAEEEMGAIDVQ